MHRRSRWNQNLALFDPEIEATARQQRGEARRRKEAVVVTEEDNRLLRDYALSQASNIASSIVSPAIEANNFELIPALITFIEWEQFDRHPSKKPNVHLRKFLVKCNTIKLNGVSTNAIRLRLFPCLLKDRGSD